ncbi:ParH-like protein [Streptomyces mobaraensis]|uniref:ParH-like protein n=1 Tax=Streptomyces mobaraensis TaxID=35621 RepID=UPI0033E1D979
MTPLPGRAALRARRAAGRRLRRCRALADGLELPVPFDAAELAERIARRRGRPIDLMPADWRSGLPCGLLISADQADYIVYVADTPPLHREHILVHELAHLLCEHHGSPSGTLLPHLPSALVGRVLGRTAYSEPQEEEAELLASLILQRAVWTESATGPPDPLFGPPSRTGRGRP